MTCSASRDRRRRRRSSPASARRRLRATSHRRERGPDGCRSSMRSSMRPATSTATWARSIAACSIICCPRSARSANKPRFIYTGGCWLFGATGDAIATEETALDPLPAFAWMVPHLARVLAAPEVDGIVIHPGDGLRAPTAASSTASPATRRTRRGPRGRQRGRALAAGAQRRSRALYALALERAPARSTWIGAANRRRDGRPHRARLCEALRHAASGRRKSSRRMRPPPNGANGRAAMRAISGSAARRRNASSAGSRSISIRKARSRRHALDCKTKSPRTRACLNPGWPGNLERAKGLEPSTPTLARSCSTTELHPHPFRRLLAGNAQTYAKCAVRLQQP